MKRYNCPIWELNIPTWVVFLLVMASYFPNETDKLNQVEKSQGVVLLKPPHLSSMYYLDNTLVKG